MILVQALIRNVIGKAILKFVAQIVTLKLILFPKGLCNHVSKNNKEKL